jgi:hypothetical protein
MGEYADYILNGDDCQYCGEYLGEGDGFPRTCKSCRDEDRKQPPKRAVEIVAGKDAKPQGQIMGKKLRRAMLYPVTCEGGMYEGCHHELAPAMFTKLEKWGFVETRYPHNAVHKPRVVLTSKGEEAYKAIRAGKPVYIPN